MTLSVDGSNTTANSLTTTITTTKTNNIILLFQSGETNDPATSITDAAGLTWTKFLGPVTAHDNNFPAATVALTAWWALSSGILTGNTITTHGAAADGRLMVMAVNGANTTSPFDGNASNNNTATGGNTTTSLSISNSTDNSNTMLVGFIRAEQGPGTGLAGISAPSGFSSVLSGGTFTGLYNKILSSTQSGVSETFSWTNANAAVYGLTAIQAKQTPQPYFERMIGGM